METKKYNGYTNYETWKVNMDILGDIEFDGHVDANLLKDIVEDVVFSNYDGQNSFLMYDYAKVFVSEVNYYEIAENINDEIDINLQKTHNPGTII